MDAQMRRDGVAKELNCAEVLFSVTVQHSSGVNLFQNSECTQRRVQAAARDAEAAAEAAEARAGSCAADLRAAEAGQADTNALKQQVATLKRDLQGTKAQVTAQQVRPAHDTLFPVFAYRKT